MGANAVTNTAIYLGNRPRLICEMLALALTEMLHPADIRQVDTKQLGSIELDNETRPAPWILLAVPHDQDLDPQARTILSQHPQARVALLSRDGRTLHVYHGNGNGAQAPAKETHNPSASVYTDISLAELVEILQTPAG